MNNEIPIREMRDTPETDSFFEEWTFTSGVLAKSRLHAEKLERERDEARELAEQMSESNQVLMADVKFYRQAWEQLKKEAK